MKNKDWKQFEALVAEIQKTLSSQAKVEQNIKIQGKNSKTPREVDVCVRAQIGQYQMLIAIECKDYRRKVALPEVEKFATKLQDIEANQGAMVAANGFSESAKKFANSAGIKLYRVVDLRDHKWKMIAHIPVVLRYTGPRQVQINYSGESPNFESLYQYSPDEVELFDENAKSIGTVHQLLHDFLSELQPLPTGTQTVTLPKNVFIADGSKFKKLHLSFTLDVAEYLYSFDLPLEELSGFEDQISGGVATNRFVTSSIKLGEIHESYKLINSIDDLAIKPMLTMSLYMGWLDDATHKKIV